MSRRLQLVAFAAVWGVIALVLWTWASGKAAIALYSFIGRPERSALTWWSIILVPAFGFGVVGGFILWLVARSRSLSLLPQFWGGLFFASVVGALMSSDEVVVLDFIGGQSTWVFVAGSCVVPLLGQVRATHS